MPSALPEVLKGATENFGAILILAGLATAAFFVVALVVMLIKVYHWPGYVLLALALLWSGCVIWEYFQYE